MKVNFQNVSPRAIPRSPDGDKKMMNRTRIRVKWRKADYAGQQPKAT